MRKRLVIGHRGAPQEGPENTLLAFEAAMNLGVDMVELDVMATADGHLICMHDWDVSRTTDGEGLVEELSLEEIRKLDAGFGQQVPLVEEVFDFLRGRIGVNVEIKIPGIERQIVELIIEKEMLDSVIVSSFFHNTLLEIKELNGDVITGVLTNNEIEDFLSYLQQFRADAYHPVFGILTEETVRQAHAAGIKVYPWTVNDESEMIKLLNWGVDGIITDFPDVCVRVVDSKFS